MEQFGAKKVPESKVSFDVAGSLIEQSIHHTPTLYRKYCGKRLHTSPDVFSYKFEIFHCHVLTAANRWWICIPSGKVGKGLGT